MNLHSWDKSHSVIMCYYFHTSLKMVCLYFAKEFCVCAHEGSSSGFGVRVTGLIMWVREHSLSLSLYFLNEFVWFWCYFFPWISSRLQWWLHEDLWIQLECNCFTCFQWFFFLIAFYSVSWFWFFHIKLIFQYLYLSLQLKIEVRYIVQGYSDMTIIVINIRKTEVCKTVHARLQVGEALGSPCPPHQVSVCIENARWIQAVGEGGSPFDSDSILETKTMRFGDNQNCV